MTAVSIACHSILVVGRDKKMHKIAKELRKNILTHLKDDKDKLLIKKLEGFIIKKNSSFFYLIKENKFEQKRTKKLKFFYLRNAYLLK